MPKPFEIARESALLNPACEPTPEQERRLARIIRRRARAIRRGWSWRERVSRMVVWWGGERVE